MKLHEVQIFGSKPLVYLTPYFEHGSFRIDDYTPETPLVRRVGFKVLELTDVDMKHAEEFKNQDYQNLSEYVINDPKREDLFRLSVEANILPFMGGPRLDTLQGRVVQELVPYDPNILRQALASHPGQ